jgi:hypothetical protein
MTTPVRQSRAVDAQPDDLRESVTALRAQALAVLQEASRNGLAAGPSAPAVARLQRVANDLGAAAALLEHDRSDRETAPAPAERRDVAATPAPSQDAAIALALAGTTMPLAYSREEEAERWLRILRLHGQVGATLRALGVPELPLETLAEGSLPGVQPERRRDPVATVAKRAEGFARHHGATTVDTVHVLFAVLEVYGPAFNRALYACGTTSDELLDRLSAGERLPGRR